MPWSNQNGGGWKSGGGPWGGGKPPGGPNQPDFENMLKRGQDKIKDAMPGKGPSGFLIFFLVMAGAAFAAWYGFFVRVFPDQQGIVLRFGAFHRQLPPGLNFRWPYPIETVYLPQVTKDQRTEIGVRGSGDARFGRGQGRDIAEESLMLTGDSNIVDVDFILFWRISDAEKYLFNIQNPERTVKEVAESVMREVVGKSDMEPLLNENRQSVEQAVLELTRKTLDSYNSGILISRVEMQAVKPPAQVIGAYEDVLAALSDKERLVNQAKTYSNRVIPEARGEAARIIQSSLAYKDQTIAESKGQADRFNQVYAEYKKAPEVTRKRMFLETMERVFSGMDKIIIDNKGGGQGVIPYLPLSELSKKNNSGGGQ